MFLIFGLKFQLFTMFKDSVGLGLDFRNFTRIFTFAIPVLQHFYDLGEFLSYFFYRNGDSHSKNLQDLI